MPPDPLDVLAPSALVCPPYFFHPGDATGFTFILLSQCVNICTVYAVSLNNLYFELNCKVNVELRFLIFE